MVLTDLTFGEEGNSDYVPTEHFPADAKVMFNISKFALMSKTILQLRSMSVGTYPFTFDKSYHSLLCSLQVRPNRTVFGCCCCRRCRRCLRCLRCLRCCCCCAP